MYVNGIRPGKGAHMLQARLCLVFTALIWGSAFIAQRISADLIGPNTFNAIRFVLGALTVSPLLFFFKDSVPKEKAPYSLLVGSLILGFVLFCGAALQQIGLIYTTASKAGFLTALYIVLVPLIGLFLGQRISMTAIFGVVVALIGTALLSLKDNFTFGWGDLVVIISTLFWAGQILLLNKYTKCYPAFKLAIGQFLGCAFYSAIVGILFEPFEWSMIEMTWPSIVWGGVLSVGLGYTGQLLGQKKVPPTEASLLMSLEMVFAGILGYLVLGERMSLQELIGVFAMCVGVFAAQLPVSESLYVGPFRKARKDVHIV